MAYGDIYPVRHRATVSTAITILQLKAGAAVPFEVLRWYINQDGGTTNAQEEIAIIRKTGAATVTAAALGTHVFKNPGAPDPGLSLGTTATGVIASAEGIDGDEWDRKGFSVLTGYEWTRTAEGELFVPAGGLLAMKFPIAPASQLWNFGMVIRELG